MATSFSRAARRLPLPALLVLGACGGGSGLDEASSDAADGTRERAQAIAAPAQARWGAPVTLSLVPGSSANLPDGKLLFWAAQDRWSFFTNRPGSTYTVVYDPVTGSRTERLASETNHNMFCPGTTNLPDGRLLVNGGSSSGDTSLYDPATNRWTAVAQMKIPRAYQGNTLLPDGSVFTLGGSWNGGLGNKHAEVWTAAGGWRLLSGVRVDPMVGNDPAGIYRSDNHMWLLPTAHGRVLHAGPSARMNWIDTRGNGAVTSAGNRGDDPYAINGNTVMYDIGKVLKVGGAPAYENVNATNSAHLIDVTDGTARVRRLASMAYARAFHNSVVLPNGQVVVIGGQTFPVPFSDNRSVLVPELWDPATERFTSLPPMTVPRNYHSSALLMPDARVIALGGGLCGAGCAANHPDFQILTPHYLLNADGTPAARPAITAAPTTAAYGTGATVTTDRVVTAFSLVRLSSTTHTVNNDQRRIPLAFTTTGTRQYRLEIPDNPGIALPGFYMLFALDAQGVPSVARTLRISGASTPQLQPPGEQLSSVNGSVDLQLLASGSGTLSYAASGLPPGLSINTASGRITGSPTTVGTYQAKLMVSNASGRVATSVRWVVQAAVGGAVRYVRFEALSEVLGRPWTTIAEFNLLDTAGATIPRTGWVVSADSQETAAENAAASRAIDGDAATFWHTQWQAAAPPPPHRLQIDLGVARAVNGFRLLPRQTTNNGRVADWRLHGSLDGVTWAVLASGRFADVATEQRVFPLNAGSGNRPPSVVAPAGQSNRVGDTVSLQVAASDPDGDVPSFTATGLPTGLSIASNGRISGTPSATGNYSTRVTVSDGRGGSASVTFSWTVLAAGVTIGPVAAAPAVSGSTVSYTASAQGSGLRYAWNFGDGSATTAASTSASTTHRYTAPGVYAVTLTVTDASGAAQTRNFLQAIHATVPTGAGPAQSSAIGLQRPATGNARLWVVNPDADTVSVFDAVTLAKLGEVTVGAAPRAAAVAPDGRLWVTNKRSASISVVDLGTRTVVSTIALPRASAPFGIVFAPNGSAAFVALEASGRVLRLNTSTGAVLATRDAGANPRHLSITRDSARLLVSRFVTPPLPGEGTASVATTVGGALRGGEVLVLEAASLAVNRTIVLRHSDKADSTLQGRGVPNYLGAAVVSPDGSSAWLPSKQDNVRRGTLRDGLPLTFENTVRAISSRIDLATLAEDYPARLDHDNAGLASAAAFHPTGAYLFVALQTSRQIAVVDPYRRRELFRLEAGRSPDALVVSADGRRLFAQNFMDRTVQVYDLTSLVTQGASAAPTQATLAAQASERLPANVLRGKQFFYDARDTRIARDAYISCASCHNDGGQDGRTWDFTGFGEGLRNTISLRGRAGGQGRRHWSGNFDETQDFEGQIRTLNLGTGLMTDAQFNTGTRNQPLGQAKAGVSADLDALAAYVASLSSFDQSPLRNADGSLTAAAVAGKAVFTRSCASCHAGNAFTDSAGNVLRNVGTIKASSGRRLGATLTGIDTPTLRDAWATAPYLHDGSAATVSAAISAHSGLTLTATELGNVAAYVQQIGSEEAVSATSYAVRYVRLRSLSEVSGNAWSSMAEFNLLDASGALVPRTGWVASANSQDPVTDTAAKAIDGLATTIWHSVWRNGASTPHPHDFTVNLGAVRTVGGFRYLPRSDAWTNGRIANWQFFVSVDGTAWQQVAAGAFTNTADERSVVFGAAP